MKDGIRLEIGMICDYLNLSEKTIEDIVNNIQKIDIMSRNVYNTKN